MNTVTTQEAAGKSPLHFDIDVIAGDLGVTGTFLVAADRFLESHLDAMAGKGLSRNNALTAEIEHARNMIDHANHRLASAKMQLDALVDGGAQ